MNEYTIANASSDTFEGALEGVTQIVDSLTKDGWKPIGGISLCQASVELLNLRFYCAQAMIR